MRKHRDAALHSRGDTLRFDKGHSFVLVLGFRLGRMAPDDLLRMPVSEDDR